jgi:hypothetical protein
MALENENKTIIEQKSAHFLFRAKLNIYTMYIYFTYIYYECHLVYTLRKK